MLTLHWAQVPPPPQAEDTKTLLSASTLSSLPPAGTERALLSSSLMRIRTLPLGTSRERATKITATRASTTPVNMPTPEITSVIKRSFLL